MFFEWFSVRNISSINITNFVLKLLDETFFFLVIFDNSMMIVLDEFFIDNDINH